MSKKKKIKTSLNIKIITINIYILPHQLISRDNKNGKIKLPKGTHKDAKNTEY